MLIFESSSQLQILSLETILSCNAVLCFPQNSIACVMNVYAITRAKRLSKHFVHFVTTRASLFTDHTISGLPTR